MYGDPGYRRRWHVTVARGTIALAVAASLAVASFLVWYAVLLVVAVIAGQPLGGPFAIVFVLLVPPWMLLGFAVAWLVPGSFPRRRGLVMDALRWARSKLAAKPSRSVGVAKVER